MVPQTTLSRSSRWIVGPQLDQDSFSCVRFHPAPAESGIVFIRSDLPNNPLVKCCLENLRAQSRWTSLEQDGVWIHHTEHILAAVAGTEVDNVLIEVSTDRIPVVSAGSCGDFLGAFLKAGIKEYEIPRHVFELQQAFYHQAPLHTPAASPDTTSMDIKRYILGIPAKSFSASYVFHVPHIDGMRIGLAEYDATVHSFADDISRARSYFLECEAAEIKKSLGPAQRDFIVLKPRSPNSLVNEVAQHKVIDFIGDLMVLGQPIVGRFVAFRSGHHHHHDLIRWMMNNGYIKLRFLT